MSVFDETWERAYLSAVMVDGVAHLEPNVERNRLAAAAPEMYRALKSMGEDWSRGNGECRCCGGPYIGREIRHTVDCALAAALAKAEGR